MRKYTRITQKKRYSWASSSQKYRGTLFVANRWTAAAPIRDNVNAGYWLHILGFRLARSTVTHEDPEV
jgi:hypothetical protein